MAFREKLTFGVAQAANKYTVTTLPAAADNLWAITIATDASGGLGAICFSNGTDWIDVATGIAVVV